MVLAPLNFNVNRRGRAVWAIRVTAWIALLAAVTRPLANPTKAWIEGRASQLQFQTDVNRASAALIRELGIEHLYDPALNRIFNAEGYDHGPRFGEPIRMVICDLPMPDYIPVRADILFDRDLQPLLPPLTARYIEPGFWGESPLLTHLEARDGSKMILVCVDNAYELRGWTESSFDVWRHESNRWTRLVGVGTSGYRITVETEHDDDGQFLRQVRFSMASGRQGEEPVPPLVVRWDKDGESFVVDGENNPAFGLTMEPYSLYGGERPQPSPIMEEE